MSKRIIFSSFSSYCLFGISYGIVRGTVKTYNGKINHYEDDKINFIRPLLYSEKVLIILANGVGCSIYSPFYIYKDIHNYELKQHGYLKDKIPDNLSEYISII